MTTTTDTPRIYIACLASYNSGIMHGEWIDAIDADDIRSEIEDMLSESPTPGAEEYAIHDYDGFGGLTEEWPDLDELAELGAAIAKYGEAFLVYVDSIGTTEPTADGFEEAYCGEWDSEKAYAEDLFGECHEIPDYLASYIDYDAIARDLFIGDYYSMTGPSGQLYVFSYN